MNIYEARWNNAVNVAHRIKSLMDKGHKVFNEKGELIVGNFHITDKIIHLIENVNSNRYTTIYFENDKDWDHGLYTTIKEWNKQFSKWTFVHPKDVKRLFK